MGHGINTVHRGAPPSFVYISSGVVYEYPHVGSLDSSLTVGSIAVVCYGCARVSAKVRSMIGPHSTFILL